MDRVKDIAKQIGRRAIFMALANEDKPSESLRHIAIIYDRWDLCVEDCELEDLADKTVADICLAAESVI